MAERTRGSAGGNMGWKEQADCVGTDPWWGGRRQVCAEWLKPSLCRSRVQKPHDFIGNRQWWSRVQSSDQIRVMKNIRSFSLKSLAWSWHLTRITLIILYPFHLLLPLDQILALIFTDHGKLLLHHIVDSSITNSQLGKSVFHVRMHKVLVAQFKHAWSEVNIQFVLSFFQWLLPVSVTRK